MASNLPADFPFWHKNAKNALLQKAKAPGAMGVLEDFVVR